MSEMNYWLEPEKITESFVWFCYSKISEEQLEGCLLDYRQQMKDYLRKELKKRNPLPKGSGADEDVKIKRDEEIEMEVIKNDSVVVNQMVKDLKFNKDDWKKILDSKVKQVRDYDER